MPALKLRRIDLSANTAAAQITKLRDQFRIDAEVVIPASKKLTQAVFGEALTPAEASSASATTCATRGCRRSCITPSSSTR